MSLLRTAAGSLRLGFAGTPAFAVAALDALVRSPHTIAAVFTQPDRPAGRGRTLHEGAVKARARALGLPVHQPANFKSPEAVELVRSLGLDALVVVAFGLILPQSVLSAPRLGCFNIHASLLPRWRGAAPIQRALLAGDAATGITIMRMELGLDTGPMLAIRSIDIGARDTAGTLHDRLAALGGELMCETLSALAAGSARAVAQSAVGVTYAAKLTKAEARIDWREDARGILRQVRAFNPWPIAETTLDGAQLRIWDAELACQVPDAAAQGTPGAVAGPNPDAVAHGNPGAAAGFKPGAAAHIEPGTVLAASDQGIDVACGAGTLRITRLQLQGRKPLSAREFQNARPLAGACFRGA